MTDDQWAHFNLLLTCLLASHYQGIVSYRKQWVKDNLGALRLYGRVNAKRFNAQALARRKARRLTATPEELEAEKQKWREHNRVYKTIAGNRTRINERMKEWKKKRAEADPSYKATKRDKHRAWQRAFTAKERSENPEAYRKRQAKWAERNRNKRKNDPVFRFVKNLRNRVDDAIRSAQNGRKSCRLTELIGCSIAEFRKHIESKFEPGMKWELFGKGPNKLSLDHVRPLASFDLKDPEQQRAAFHWSNTAPKWFGENSSKNSQWQGRRWRHGDRACKETATA